jgi:hypothetical protein
MSSKERRAALRLDVLGLFLAGLNNTFLALFVAVVIHGPGTAASQPDLLLRATWIAEHPHLWKVGWLFWFAPTLSFSWSYYALGRHLDSARQWRNLAIGVALIAAAVDIVGVLVNMTVLPELAHELTNTIASPDSTLQVVFLSMEKIANNLTNIGGFGLYSLAGLLLMPAAFATLSYSRWLVWLGMAEWGFAIIATILLVFAPAMAIVPLLVSFMLYAPWVWGSAMWLLRSKPENGAEKAALSGV